MRKWVSPKAVEENFTSNQNVANSISGCFSVYCMISGDGKGKFTGNKYFNQDVNFTAEQFITMDRSMANLVHVVQV